MSNGVETTAAPVAVAAGCGAAVPALMATEAIRVASAAVEELGLWWQRLLRSPAPALQAADDLLRVAEIALDRREPRWHSPNTVIADSPLTALRDFSSGGADAGAVPTLVLPPQAGHHSSIIDFSPRQSQMQTIRAAGLERAFALEWKPATAATSDAGIEDVLAEVHAAVERIGAPVNLVGDCQGGWLAAIYTALNPSAVHTLTVAGAPIDFHAGLRAPIPAYVDGFTAGGRDMAFYRALVAAGGGVLPGESQLLGFIALKPEAEVRKQLALLSRLDDPEHVERHRAFEDWFKWTQPMPGALYLWIVERLFRDNALVRGSLVVGGQAVSLAEIRCPLYLLAGADDHITPPAQLFALADHVSTPRADITVATAPAGHLGLFMGSSALRAEWPALMADVARRSR
jgi:poly(3-hydroxyalkanoate) synthetase